MQESLRSAAETFAAPMLSLHVRLDAGLHPYQPEGVPFLPGKRRDDMGLGRTCLARVTPESTGAFLVAFPPSLNRPWRRQGAISQDDPTCRGPADDSAGKEMP